MSGSLDTRKRRRTRASAVAEEPSPKRQQLDTTGDEKEASEASPVTVESQEALNVTMQDGEAQTEDDVTRPPLIAKPESALPDEVQAISTSANVEPAFEATGTHQSLVEPIPTSRPVPWATYATWADPNLHLRVQSLPILENLSSQILESLAKGSYQETLTVVTEPESAPGQAYASLKSLFDQTKRLYSNSEPFLSAHELSLRDPEHRNIIRKANLATFVSSVFGSHDVGFYYLNEYFLETFVPDGGRLLKSQGGLYLDLKTQAYLSAMANGERTRDEILEDLFPNDLEDRLLSRRPGARQLSPSEIDFVKRARSRRDHLLSVPDEDEALAALPDKYVWEDFLRDVTNYISKSFDDLASSNAGSRARVSPYVNNHVQQSMPVVPPVEKRASDMQKEEAHLQEILQAHNEEYDSQVALNQEVVERAAQAAQIALQNELLANSRKEEVLDEQGPNYDEEEAPQPEGDEGSQLQNNAQTFGSVPEVPYHTQTAPTQVLYERARLAAMAKASPNNRRAGLPSQRRPWSQLEENALMAGLDRVKGPHWSQILAMFGPGGTINEILKDRNQVQLKDKARNLKLFFLKSGIEVPYYLQCVTGELKTRAPSQAAKNEAKERARLSGDEERAHVEGILALAGGAHYASLDDNIGAPSEESKRNIEPSPGNLPEALSPAGESAAASPRAMRSRTGQGEGNVQQEGAAAVDAG
ncbi:MAG: TTAGGG repeat binding factor [Piccolia ochrophora]|nr:MAG: TTAGGG repeat binding factor [Piccolia ochrophora]